MINSGEAGTYVPSLAARSILSSLPTFTGPLASLRKGPFGVDLLGVGAVVGILIVAEHLRRRRS